MDKKTFIGLVLIGLIFLLWPVYMKKVVGVKEQPEQTVTQQTEAENKTAPITEPETEAEPAAGSETQEPAAYSKAVVADDDVYAEDVVMENDLFRGELSSKGGGTVTSWRLKEHRDDNGEWLELIPDTGGPNLGMVIGDPIQRQYDLRTAVFTVALDSHWTENGKRFQRVEFVKKLNPGSVVKQYTITDGSYNIEMAIWVNTEGTGQSPRNITLSWANGLNPTETDVKRDIRYCEAIAHQGGDLLKASKKPTGFREGNTDWVAVRSKYFVAAVIPQDLKGAGAQLNAENITVLKDGEEVGWKRLTAEITVPLARNYRDPVKVITYIGPLDYTTLKGFGQNLEKLMNFGWVLIRPFSIAFFYMLQFLFGIFKDYGIAIIVFSILIKIVLYPLTRKSYKSMHDMQALQPKISALRDKHKDNPQKLNEETMKLYKKHGVNPMGGCLPMLLQMPVLFALFNLFRTTIMLRHATFLGGLIMDLSAPDQMLGGVNVLPILMSITMIFQQRLTNKDPKQKAMMYFMPIFMAFIFYRLSAGLNLYYFMFNILTIAQELLVGSHKKKDMIEQGD